MTEQEQAENVEVKIDESRYASFRKVKSHKGARKLMYWILALFFILFIIMFLPWTQNVRGEGQLTTLRPEQRPQKVYSIISGRVEQWHVIEGQEVEKGDTLVYISEVKDKFLDPDLIKRTENQLAAKKLAAESYGLKVDALTKQIKALNNDYLLKKQQAENKIIQAQRKVDIDSTNFSVAAQNYDIAETRVKRADSLYKEGILSLKELESRRIKLQDQENKLVSAENKLIITRNGLFNAKLSLNNLYNQFNTKIYKAESDKLSAESARYNAQATVNKLENELSNYEIRNGYYYITAPNHGYIVKTFKPGTGEIIKEGAPIVEIMPLDVEIAAALYVRPVDLALMKVGERMRLTFDGWPALVFSGWPNSSFGTFSGEVYAIDEVISKNGKFRILVIPDKEDKRGWPEELRVGTGAEGIFLLNEVPIWYELWRQINGFPPDFYDGKKSNYQRDKEIGHDLHTEE